MGAGIALAAAIAGFGVDLVEPDTAARERATERIAKDAQRAGAGEAAARITYLSGVQSTNPAFLAIEAVPERLDLKRHVFRSFGDALGPQALLATNTSSLSVADIADGMESPQRILGLHFFNPPVVMKLVEVIYTQATSDEAIERARAFVEQLGKTPVLAADTPGFIVNRVARPFYLQSLRAYEAGVAPIEDLDRLARGVGFRMGPFELMDLIGLDVNLATTDSVFERTGADRFEAVPVQRALVAENRLGRKTKAGFYDYSEGVPKWDDSMPAPPQEINSDERVVIIGFGGLALELEERLRGAYAHVRRWENEETLDEIPLDTTILIDVGDGASDRSALLQLLDSTLPGETVIFADAYATDLAAAADRLQFPDRLAGYGILASLEQQRVVEIVDSETTADETLELAQELFEAIGRRVVLTAGVPGLFLGRTVASIVNEAVYVVDEQIATPEDVDLAMQLGTNYPLGPIAWGREIGGDRVRRILQRVAKADGAAFAPHRALWVLDAQSPEEAAEAAVEETPFSG